MLRLFLTLSLVAIAAFNCAPVKRESTGFFTHYSKKFGNDDGVRFATPIPNMEGASVRKVVVKASSLVKSIKFEYSDAKGNTVASPEVGAPLFSLVNNPPSIISPIWQPNPIWEINPIMSKRDDGSVEWVVPAGEYITKVEVRYGTMIDALTFITDMGTRSPQFGENGGILETLDLEGHLV
jgi:hypothetical protein